MKTGFYAVGMANMSKVNRRLIEHCVSCKARAQQLCAVEIGPKFGAIITRAELGLFNGIGIDVLGPYR